MRHIPVLADAVVRVLDSKYLKGGVFIDLTLGLGGHASLVAQKLAPKRIIGFDRDKDMLVKGEENLRKERNIEQELEFHNANYASLDEILSRDLRANAILLDLGVASPHFDDASRGMSFRFDGPLDMRLDRSQAFTAADIINTYTEHELGKVLRDFGEERHWRAVARRLVAVRNEPNFQGIKTTNQLVSILEPILGPRRGRIHPVTKVFQALRMEVNDELYYLKKALPQAISRLAGGGKLAVISFHSLEDRIVKEVFVEALESRVATTITKNPVEASKEEIAANSRSRSAKLRVLTKAE